MSIEVKKTTKTELKIKSANIVDNKMIVDGEVVDFCEMVVKVFGERPFDLAISESVKEEIDIDEIIIDEVDED